MKFLQRIITLVIILVFSITNWYCKNSPKPGSMLSATEEYKCTPCGYDCDKEVFTKPGICPHCNMELVKASTIHFRTIQPGEICRYILAHPAVVLLDVRTPEEFEGKANPDFGTLKNSVNIPVGELESKLSRLDSLKDREFIVYCSHSHRSPQASYLLTQHGFTNVVNMAGGMSVMTDASCKK